MESNLIKNIETRKQHIGQLRAQLDDLNKKNDQMARRLGNHGF